MSALHRYPATFLWCAYIGYLMGVVQYFEVVR